MNAFAEIEVAQNYDDVTRFLEENQDDTVALLFMDSTASSQSSGGVFSGIFSSIGSIFSGSGDSASSEDQVAQIEKEISDEAALMQIDVSLEDLKEIQESYDVTQVPFLIVFKRGIVVLKEVPDKETHDEILQVMNVTPASQRAEAEASADDTTVEADASAETTPEAEAAEPAAEPVAAEEATPAEEPAPADDETVVKPISVRQAPPSPRPAPRPAPTIVEPISVAQPKPKPSLKEPEKSFATGDNQDQGANTGAPRSFELLRNPPPPAREEQKPTTQEKVTLAPGESQQTDSSAQEIPASRPTRPTPAAKPEAKAAPAKKEREHVDPDSRRKYVFHKCHEMGTHNDCEPLDWRTNPYYIPELEDYEVPEDWWRNGYAPITDGDNDADNRTKCERENCRVPPPPVDFVPPEPHVYHVPEPVHVAHIPEPVHVAHVPEPVHVAHIPEPARVVEAPVRVAQAPVRPAVVAEPAPRFVGKKYTGRNATVTAHEVPVQAPIRTVREVGPTPVVGPAPVVTERVVGPRLAGNVHTSRPAPVKTSTTTKAGKR